MAGVRRMKQGGARTVRSVRALLVGALLGLALALASVLPFAPAEQWMPIAAAHPILLRSDPAAGASLSATPTHIQLDFSEPITVGAAELVVRDASGRQVDRRDVHVPPNDPRALVVSVPSLAPGSYSVEWRVTSDEDGHIVSGGYSFTVLAANAVPAGTTAPTGPASSPAASGTASTQRAPLDGPALAQVLATWLALLCATFWVGGVFWETWVLPPLGDSTLAHGAQLAARRFARLAPWAIGALLLSNLLLIGAQAVALGGWGGLTALPLLRDLVWGSRFGRFWLLREVAAGAALALLLVAARWKLAGWRTAPPLWQPLPASAPGWRHEVAATLRAIGELPARVVAGWRARNWLGRAYVLLAALLLLAFALTGHAAAVPGGRKVPAIAVDLLHLAGTGIWLGGLLYCGAVLLPALRGLAARERMEVLARGLPSFSAVALVSVALLATTGAANSTVRLTSVAQLWSTPYGLVLLLKSALFVAMASMSAYHAFVLRPRLARALAATPADVALVSVGGSARPEQQTAQAAVPAPPERLAGEIAAWLRREAGLGLAILACVALLAALAGTLAPASSPAASASSAASGSAPAFRPLPNAQQVLAPMRLYPVARPEASVMRPAVDAQGNVWFGEMKGDRLARLNPRTGVIAEWTPPNAGGGLMTVALDAAGNVWFAEEEASYIGRFDPRTQTFATFPLQRTAEGKSVQPQDLRFDGAGDLWFTEVRTGRIGRLTPATGAIRTWDVLPQTQAGAPHVYSLELGQDGSVWFGAALPGGLVGRLDPQTGTVSLFPLPRAAGQQFSAQVVSMAADGRGHIWFAELEYGRLGRIDLATQTVTEVPVPAPTGDSSGVYAVTTTADGQVWFSSMRANALIRYTPASGIFDFYTLLVPQSIPYGLTSAPDGSLWFTANSQPTNYIGHLVP